MELVLCVLFIIVCIIGFALIGATTPPAPDAPCNRIADDSAYVRCIEQNKKGQS